VAGAGDQPGPSRGGKPKVRLVFCETTNDRPIWPNIGYDFDARRRQVIDVLTKGCPDVQFLPTKVMDKPADAADVIRGDGEVDGYILCVQGLGWRNDIVKMSATGKPTLIVDNLFGGSGLFLARLQQIMASGKPVDWVSSSDDQDIVASASHFTLLKQGKTPADVAAAFRTTRRKNTPNTHDWTCEDDPIPEPDFGEALKRLSETKILVAGRAVQRAFQDAAKDVLGVTFTQIGFPEIADAYNKADREAAKATAQQWIGNSEEAGDAAQKDIENSAAMYAAMKRLLAKHGAAGISMNCLGGFYGGHLKAYPCIGFSQLNNGGLVGGCEGDQLSALTMATMSALVGRPGYISDPVIDTSKNQIIYAHCTATTKPFGPEGASNPYRIKTHSEDRNGAALQSLLPAGYMTTTLRINPVARQVLMHQAKSVGNNPSDMACRTKLEAVVRGDIEKLTENWGASRSWHRVTFYGDLEPQVVELCDRLKLELTREA